MIHFKRRFYFMCYSLIITLIMRVVASHKCNANHLAQLKKGTTKEQGFKFFFLLLCYISCYVRHCLYVLLSIFLVVKTFWTIQFS